MESGSPTPQNAAQGGTALHLEGLTKLFPLRSPLLRRVTGNVRAVDDVTLSVGRRETLGLVGESGSGKSTLGRLALRLIDPTSGPRATIANNVGEPLERHFNMTRKQRDQRVGELLDEVSLSHTLIHRYPHEFSGGQLQRIALARALSVRPTLLVADEPVTAGGVSVTSRFTDCGNSMPSRLPSMSKATISSCCSTK